MEDLKINPTYEYATLTEEQIGAITAIKIPEIKELSSGFNGLSTADFSNLKVSSISPSTIDTLPTVSLTGGVSQGYTINAGTNIVSGTGSNLTWNSPTWTTTTGPYYTSGAVGSGTGSPMSVGNAGQLDLRGENADIIVNGKSLMSMLERIEERLNLLKPNTDLEAEWDELKELGDRYRELEQRCKEKAEIWKKLKDMPPPKLA